MSGPTTLEDRVLAAIRSGAVTTASVVARLHAEGKDRVLAAIERLRSSGRVGEASVSTAALERCAKRTAAKPKRARKSAKARAGVEVDRPHTVVNADGAARGRGPLVHVEKVGGAWRVEARGKATPVASYEAGVRLAKAIAEGKVAKRNPRTVTRVSSTKVVTTSARKAPKGRKTAKPARAKQRGTKPRGKRAAKKRGKR